MASLRLKISPPEKFPTPIDRSTPHGVSPGWRNWGSWNELINFGNSPAVQFLGKSLQKTFGCAEHLKSVFSNFHQAGFLTANFWSHPYRTSGSEGEGDRQKRKSFYYTGIVNQKINRCSMDRSILSDTPRPKWVNSEWKVVRVGWGIRQPPWFC